MPINNYYITTRFEQNGVPVLLDRSETHNVFDNKVILDTLPDEYNKVRITHIDGVTTSTMVEIPYYKAIENTNEFKVDYKVTGFIYFHPTKEGKSIQFTYKGKGYVCVTPERIATIVSPDGSIVETLDVLVETTQQAKEDVIETNEIVNENEAIRISNENARQQNINNFKDWGNYDNTKPYVPLNKVFYEGSSFINILACQGVAPNPLGNNINWLMVVKKGTDGFSSIIETSFTATSNNTTHVVTGLTDFDPLHDNLQVFEGEFGELLQKGVHYSENVDKLSIDLIGWSLSIGDIINFKMYKNLNEDTIQQTIQNAITEKNALGTKINDAETKKVELQNVINTADLTTYASREEYNEVKNRISKTLVGTYAATSNTSVFIVPDGTFNGEVDALILKYKGITLVKDVNYSLNGNEVTLGFTITTGEIIVYEIEKNTTIEDTDLYDGSLLQNSTVNSLKLTQDVQDKISKVPVLEASLADITKFKLIADIPTTDYVTDDSVDISYIRNRQAYLYADFYRKLVKNQPVKACCMGDSMTNGQDTVSADARPVTSDVTRNLSEPMSSQTIASTTYPEALQTNLRSIFGNQVSVLNRGYSGDWVKAGHDRYNTKHDSNLTIIMYGTNDSRASWVPEDIRGDISDYVNWYEQLIIREILWGKAVIILTPPKLQTANDVDIKTFANALKMLGEKYGVPVVDSALFTANFPSTIYCDTVHYNGNGYKVFASKVTAFLLSGTQVNRINDGDTLLTRPNIDSAIYYGGAIFTSSGGAVETPAEINTASGVIGQISGVNKGIIYSFYTEENDLMILPYYYNSTQNMQLTLDFNTVSPHNSIDNLVDATSGTLNEVPLKQVLYTLSGSPRLLDLIKPIGDSAQPALIRIVEKGWHTLKVETTDPSGLVVLNGIHFMNYRNFKQQRELLKLQSVNNVFHKVTHSAWSASPSSVASIDIPCSELNTLFTGNLLNLNEDYKAIPLKVILHNSRTNIIEFGFIWHDNGVGGNTPTGGFYSWSIKQTDLIASPTNFRTITSITYDSVNRKYVINFGGNLNQLGSVVVQPI